MKEAIEKGETRCPICGTETTAQKLVGHLRKYHKIYYGYSKETFDSVIRKINSLKVSDNIFRCPSCSSSYTDIRILANHYFLAHSQPEYTRKKKSRKRNYKPKKHEATTKYKTSRRPYQGGAPGLGKKS